MSVSFSGIVPDNNPVNSRILADAAMKVTKALPAASGAQTTTSNALDLKVAVPYPTTETINVSLTTEASADGNSVTGNIVLQDTTANSDGTANGAAWANITNLGYVHTITQASGSTAATAALLKLPPSVRQFIRMRIQVPANTGNLSDADATLQLLF